MRLTQIKLAGFKSFVDPTTVIVPKNLVGIVGPNGCGKSNIIDAITWVMGESSAKHLRGDNLTDVIFNGSTSRQPVGQTSVELEFDNSDSKLGGQYASYAEISIKRQMNREGISTYFLNGSRCRRRDIQAIFLGTGLGPRSYAIIEQGVISRLIEAKPEELRVFIEEAAGISKYRERRRETENRIRHTKDNIDRLNDIREELGKQLGTLKRQSRAAERYQELKKDERRTKSELLVINWRDLSGMAAEKNEITTAAETAVEQGIAGIRHAEAQIEQHRNRLVEANDALNNAQSDFYQVGSEIANLEQKIQHGREKRQALQLDMDKTRDLVTSTTQQYESDQSRLQSLANEVESLTPRLQGSRSDSNSAYDSLNQSEVAMQQWQTEWDSFHEAMSEYTSQIDVDTTRLEHLETSVLDNTRRREHLEKQLADTNSVPIQQQLQELGSGIDAAEKDLENRRLELEQKQAGIRTHRYTILEINDELSSKRAEHQTLAGRIASLEALQVHTAGGDQEGLVAWLSSLNMEKATRLAQAIDVDSSWSVAIETVLEHRLQDIVAEDIDQLIDAAGNLESGNVGFVTSALLHQEQPAGKRFNTLASRVNSEYALDHYLAGVYIAEDIQEALNILSDLDAEESVITPDGIWLGPGWMRINRPGEQEGGFLSREQQIIELKDLESVLLGEIREKEQRLAEINSAISNAEKEFDELQSALVPVQTELARLQSARAEMNARLEQADKRRSQLDTDLEDLEVTVDQEREEIEVIRSRLQRTLNDRSKLDAQKEQLHTLREQHRSSLDQARSQWQVTHEQSHEIALRLESISSQRASLEQTLQRTRLQLESQNNRLQELEQELSAGLEPLAELERVLAEKLNTKDIVEKALGDARNHVQAVDSEVRSAEQQRTEAEQKVQELRSELESARLEAKEIKVRLDTVQEQIQETNQTIDEIQANLPDEANKEAWSEQLATIERRINRLGPINLAAIDEYNQLSERKEYLDQQNDDLVEALSTLESAIRKIDRETRTRFKETFDELNSNLKSMFPVLFGGGHSYLLMTGEDLLDTGITIMAQPPGKKNSTIHLLSGGEKALTAVALVFAIFKLNPAPFCVLDEVDAPLDDTNVGRFSQLLQQMSTDVQFIFITHNKITMEIADQLMGVTMHEPGVSRMVSVDVEEAMELAESA